RIRWWREYPVAIITLRPSNTLWATHGLIVRCYRGHTTIDLWYQILRAPSTALPSCDTTQAHQKKTATWPCLTRWLRQDAVLLIQTDCFPASHLPRPMPACLLLYWSNQ